MRGIKRKKKKSYLSLNLNSLCFRIMCPIHYFHIDRNAPRFIPPPPPTLAPRILHNHCFQFSCPKRNPRQWLCKVLGSKQGALWSMWKWWIGGVDQHLGWLSLEISVPMWFVCICGSSVGRYIGRVALYCQFSIGWVSVDRSRLWWLGWLGWLGWLRWLGGLGWLRWLGWPGWLG